MTLPLPRSRPTTVPAPSTPTRTTSNRLAVALAAGLVLSLAASAARAQSWQRPTVVPSTGHPTSISFEPIPPLPPLPSAGPPEHNHLSLPAPAEVQPVFLPQPGSLGDL